MPAAVHEEDFLRNDYCIALSETEHRPMMQALFPQHLSRVRFWQIEDLAWESPESATSRIEEQVVQLIQELERKSVATSI